MLPVQRGHVPTFERNDLEPTNECEGGALCLLEDHLAVSHQQPNINLEESKGDRSSGAQHPSHTQVRATHNLALKTD